MTPDITPGLEETKSLIAALSDLIQNGVEETTITITTKDDWEFSVTVKVISWGAF